MLRLPMTLAALSLLLSGCDRVAQTTPAERQRARSAREAYDGDMPPAPPHVFFPVQAGTSWRYEIRIGPAEPLGYREVHWETHRTRTRSRLVRDPEDLLKSVHFLELRVRGPAEQTAEPDYTNRVELEVVQDDLAIFGEAKRLFFAAKSDPRFEAVLVTTYAPDRGGLGLSAPWGRWGLEDGYSVHLWLFGDRPGTGIGFGTNPQDRLFFLGVVGGHPQLRDGPFLRFLRQVDDEKSESPAERSYLSNGFTEETWFSRRGLVRLEQQVAGVRSMLWTLVSSGPDRGVERNDTPPRRKATRL